MNQQTKKQIIEEQTQYPDFLQYCLLMGIIPTRLRLKKYTANKTLFKGGVKL